MPIFIENSSAGVLSDVVSIFCDWSIISPESTNTSIIIAKLVPRDSQTARGWAFLQPRGKRNSLGTKLNSPEYKLELLSQLVLTITIQVILIPTDTKSRVGHVLIGDVTKNSDFRWSELELIFRRILFISSKLPVDLVSFRKFSLGFLNRFELNSPNFLGKFCIEPLEDEKSEPMPDVDSCKKRIILENL